MPVAGPAAQHPGVPSDLADAWRHTLEAWHDGPRHDTALGLAAKHEQFAWLAARYREIAKRTPDDPIPQARLARLQRAMLVTFRFDAKQTATPTKMPYRGVALLLVASVFATVIGLWAADAKTRDYHNKPHQLTSQTR